VRSFFAYTTLCRAGACGGAVAMAGHAGEPVGIRRPAAGLSAGLRAGRATPVAEARDAAHARLRDTLALKEDSGPGEGPLPSCASMAEGQKRAPMPMPTIHGLKRTSRATVSPALRASASPSR